MHFLELRYDRVQSVDENRRSRCPISVIDVSGARRFGRRIVHGLMMPVPLGLGVPYEGRFRTSSGGIELPVAVIA